MYVRLLRLLLPVILAGLCFVPYPGAGASIIFNGWDTGELRHHESVMEESVYAESFILVRPEEGANAASRERIVKGGGRIIAFIPPDAFLLFRRNATEKMRLKGADTCIPLRQSWKASRLLTETSLPDDADEVMLLIHAAETSRGLEDALLSAGASITGRSLSAEKGRIGLMLPAAMLPVVIAAASARPEVYSIQPGYGASLLNDNASAITQTGTASGGRPLWTRGLRGEGQTIVILDTGLDFDSCYHAEDNGTSPPVVLGLAQVGEPDWTRRKVVLYDLLWEPDWTMGFNKFDSQGHGTAVAGNALGSMLTDPFGETLQNGMAPGARLVVHDAGYGVDPCADLPALGCPVVDLTPFLEQAAAQGAMIHNNSWGDREDAWPANTYTGPTADMDDMMWRHPEFLILCAAGNSGSKGNDSIISPSSGKNVISVGATQSPTVSGGNPEYKASFSSLGWSSDGRIKPDIMAPGQTSTSRSDNNINSGNCTLVTIQGTSMATPVCAGSAALVRQYYMEGWHPSGQKTPSDAFTPTGALIKATLLNGTTDMTGVTGSPPNRSEGWGRVNVEHSLYFSGDARRAIAMDRRDEFTTTTSPAWEIQVDASGTTESGVLKFTLAWTDYPGDPAASTALVNDLDLIVTKLGGEVIVYRGNALDENGYSIPDGARDALNNVEMVVLPASTAGRYKVRVEPARIVYGPQGFAFVAGGDITVYEPVVPLGISIFSIY